MSLSKNKKLKIIHLVLAMLLISLLSFGVFSQINKIFDSREKANIETNTKIANSNLIAASTRTVYSTMKVLPPASTIITSIQIEPVFKVLFVGETQQFVATATFADSSTADVSNLVTWFSTKPNIGTINSNGLFTALNTGNANVYATYYESVTDSTLVSNTALVQVAVGGSNATPFPIVIAPPPTPSMEPPFITPSSFPTPSPSPTPSPESSIAPVAPTPSGSPQTSPSPQVTIAPVSSGSPSPSNIPFPGISPTPEIILPAPSPSPGQIIPVSPSPVATPSATSQDDEDGDGLSNSLETLNCPSPTNPDSDGDGLLDSEEILEYQTDPCAWTNIDEVMSTRREAVVNLPAEFETVDMTAPIVGSAPSGSLVKLYALPHCGRLAILIGEANSDETHKFLIRPNSLPAGRYNLIAETILPEEIVLKQIEAENTAISRILNPGLEKVFPRSGSLVSAEQSFYLTFAAEPSSLDDVRNFLTFTDGEKALDYDLHYLTACDEYQEWTYTNGRITNAPDDIIKSLQCEDPGESTIISDQRRRTIVVTPREKLKYEETYYLQLFPGLRSKENMALTIFREYFVYNTANTVKLVTVNPATAINPPEPISLDDRTIDDRHLIEGLQIKIENNQPVLFGKISKNALNERIKVSAVWNSLILSSATLIDADKQYFELFPSKPLEYGNHSVSIFAFTENDTKRSHAEIIKFTIYEPIYKGDLWWLILILSLILLAVFYYSYKEFKKHFALKKRKVIADVKKKRSAAKK